jgi:hypothetical protein
LTTFSPKKSHFILRKNSHVIPISVKVEREIHSHALFSFSQIHKSIVLLSVLYVELRALSGDESDEIVDEMDPQQEKEKIFINIKFKDNRLVLKFNHCSED